MSKKYETYLTTQKSITNIWKEDLITNCEFLLKTFIKSYCGYDEYLISDGVFCLLGDDCMRSGMLNSDDIGDDSYNDITNNDNSYNTGDIDDNNTNINTNNINDINTTNNTKIPSMLIKCYNPIKVQLSNNILYFIVDRYLVNK